MARYGTSVGKNVERVMKKRKKGTLKSGRSKKKITSRKQALAIALSESRRAGAKMPRRPAKRKQPAKKRKRKTVAD